MNAPRLLQEVTGDFDVQVKVSGVIDAGATSAVTGRNAFQGAGLVVWIDEKNYLRFERIQALRGPVTFTGASFEERNGGSLVTFGDPTQHPLGDTATLKLERRGNVLSAFVKDNDQWVLFKKAPVEMPEKLEVGVLAGHNTSSSLTAEFEDLRITKPEAEPAAK